MTVRCIKRKKVFKRQPPLQQLPREYDIGSKKSRENDMWKLTTICLPYVKSLSEKIRKICSPYDIKTIFTSSTTLRKYLCQVKPLTEYMTKNCIHSIPCSCSKVYKGETCRPLKVRLEEHWKVICQEEIEKLGYGWPYIEGKGKTSALGESS